MIEGLEDKGLDAKSYIQQMLRRTDGSSREEQIIQKVLFFKDYDPSFLVKLHHN